MMVNQKHYKVTCSQSDRTVIWARLPWTFPVCARSPRWMPECERFTSPSLYNLLWEPIRLASLTWSFSIVCDSSSWWTILAVLPSVTTATTLIVPHRKYFEKGQHKLTASHRESDDSLIGGEPKCILMKNKNNFENHLLQKISRKNLHTCYLGGNLNIIINN